MPDGDLKLGRQHRDQDAVEIRVARREQGGSTLTFPLSSEREIERWYGTEVLSHDKGAIRLTRANGGAMPLLFNHDWDDPIGMVGRAWIEDKRLMVEATLFDTARGREVAQMIDGGLRNVSVGYQVHVMEEEVKKARYTATDWEPLEGSIVSVPADPSVGIDRAEDASARPVRIVRAQVSSTAAPAASHERAAMPEDKAAAGAIADQQPSHSLPAQARQGPSALEMETERQTAIRNIAAANNIDKPIIDLWITSGASMARVSDELLKIIEQRGANTPKITQLGLTDKEKSRFSLARAIMACGDRNWTHAGLEAECSAEIAKRLNKTPNPNQFLVPFEIQERQMPTPLEMIAYSLARRDLTVATAGAGGYLVGTDNVGFIEMLRNQTVLFAMGARRLPGLRDNITIPKQSATGSPTWLANEAATITEINQTFVQIALSPKHVGGYTEYSRALMLQSNPQVEGLVQADLAKVVALDIDLKGLNGSGASGQPTGILNTSGIGSVTGTSLAYDDIVEFQTDVFSGNALAAQSGFVTTGAVAGLCKQRVKFASTASPLWEGRLESGVMDGYRAMASNQMSAATMIFGNFNEVIVAEWGTLEIEVNPYANFQAAIYGCRAIASIDIAVRYPSAFSAASSIT